MKIKSNFERKKNYYLFLGKTFPGETILFFRSVPNPKGRNANDETKMVCRTSCSVAIAIVIVIALIGLADIVFGG